MLHVRYDRMNLFDLVSALRMELDPVYIGMGFAPETNSYHICRGSSAPVAARTQPSV
jgi:hypothetical protein